MRVDEIMSTQLETCRWAMKQIFSEKLPNVPGKLMTADEEDQS